MIKRAKATNLQSHVDTDISFGLGVTVVKGPSDSGKSAFLRGLKWVAINRPAGDSLRRHGTKKTTMELDGVTKSRSKATHSYKLDGKVYKAIRRDVPEQVQNHLRLSEINFQDQHSPYFLIADPPGQVARTLNEVADLQIIDQSLKEAKSRVKEAKTERKSLDEQIAHMEEQMEDLQWVLEADKYYGKIEITEAKVEDNRESSRDLAKRSDIALAAREGYRIIPEPEEDRQVVLRCVRDILGEDTGPLTAAVAAVEETEVTIPDPAQDKELTHSIHQAFDTMITGEIDFSHKIGTAADSFEEFSEYPKELDNVDGVLERLLGAQSDAITLSDAVTAAAKAFRDLHAAETSHEEKKSQYLARRKEIGKCPICEGDL